jgi:hypothetical protein
MGQFTGQFTGEEDMGAVLGRTGFRDVLVLR